VIAAGAPWPSYAELPLRAGAPAGAAWGVFGEDDQLGTLNFIGPEEVVAGARLATRGAVFPLNWPLGLPDPALFGRARYRRIQRDADEGQLGHDDRLDGLHLHASSHWDALRHFGCPGAGFYGGAAAVRDDERLDIGVIARRGIATRAVLADVASALRDEGCAFDPLRYHPISVEVLDRTLRRQGVELRRGDVLLVRTGWMRAYLASTLAQRTALARSVACFSTAGLSGTEVAAYLWDRGVAAVAADNPALEAWPGGEARMELHDHLLARLGMPLGELFYLEELATDCAADGDYAALLTSAPLDVAGGTGGPPNALAIK